MKNVSVIIPIYNEELYIVSLVNSIIAQDYQHDKLEVIFVDGTSLDNSVALLKKGMDQSDIKYKVLINNYRNVSKSLNQGIRESSGEIIVRLDGHSEIVSQYITLNVHYLQESKASNVGCLIETKGKGLIGSAIAGVLSSPFGVGNSSFRIGSNSGYVDTVPFGCWDKKIFDAIGFFDELLTRSEDNELNSRIIKNGGKVYLFDDISSIYYPRASISSLIKMALANGQEIIQTMIKHPDSFRLRYLIPFIFVTFLVVGLIGSCFSNIILVGYLGVLGLYLFMDLVFSFFLSCGNKISIISSLIKFIIFIIFHISYGLGSYVGLFKMMIGKDE